MAINTPGGGEPLRVIDSVVLGTVHMHIKRGTSVDILDLLVTSFTEEEILAAKTELIEMMSLVVPSGHRDTAERTAASLYSKELVTLVQELDKDNRLPKVVVSSDHLVRIPLGKVGLSPSDAVPISARMNDLEDTVKKLCDSFEKFKSDSKSTTAEGSFASVAARQLGAVQRLRPGQAMAAGSWQGAGVPNVSVTGPPQLASNWANEMDQAGQGHGQGYRQGGLGGGHLGINQHRPRGRSGSPKRPREDGETDGGGQYQTVPPRKPRKVTYGKSKVTMDGAEAAPVEIFVGNTNPRATPDIITKVMKKCALDLPEKIELEVHEVKCLNNLDTEPNPRTKCWKISVPYKYKELMERDELYPTGWSHRKFFAPRQNNAKKPKPDDSTNKDPFAEFLPGAGSGSNSA